jgi:hypothetical protein
MIDIREEEKSDLQRMEHIPGELLQDCIKQAKDEDMEILARFAYWRYANHDYRKVYEAHREAEERQNKINWDTSQKELQSWWKKVFRFPTPEYTRSATSTFTFPPYKPSPEQIENMTRLSAMLLDTQKLKPNENAINLAELYRELGRFEEAKFQIAKISINDTGNTIKVISEFIEKKEAALIRYRM